MLLLRVVMLLLLMVMVKRRRWRLLLIAMIAAERVHGPGRSGTNADTAGAAVDVRIAVELEDGSRGRIGCTGAAGRDCCDRRGVHVLCLGVECGHGGRVAVDERRAR